MAFWVLALTHKLYPDQTLMGRTVQSIASSNSATLCAHSAGTSRAMYFMPAELPFADVLVVGVFQDELTYLLRRGLPILGSSLPALKPCNVCQQWVGEGVHSNTR